MPPAIADRIGGRRWQPIGGGQSGADVFRLSGDDGDLVLKVGCGPAAELVAEEIARSHWLTGRVRCPIVVASAADGTATWLLTTALPGLTAGDYIKADRSRAVGVATAMAGLLRELHALPVGECPFDSSVTGWLPGVRQLVADGRVDTDDFDDEHSDWSAQRVLAKVEELAHHARGRVVLHGDYSLGNLMLDGDGTISGCIDVGRLGVGDPYRDIFIGWRDLGGFGAEAQAAFLAGMGTDDLDPDRRELHRALDELF